MDNIEILDECGFGKPITRLKLQDKADLIQAVTLHRVLLKSLAETTQFRNGLSALSVRESLEKYPKLCMQYYCSSESDVLNSGTFFLKSWPYCACVFMQICCVSCSQISNILWKVHQIELMKKQHLCTLWTILMIVKEVKYLLLQLHI